MDGRFYIFFQQALYQQEASYTTQDHGKNLVAQYDGGGHDAKTGVKEPGAAGH